MMMMIILILSVVNAAPPRDRFFQTYIPPNENMQFVETKTFGRVSYIDLGSQQRDKTVVFLHGARFTAQTWDSIGILGDIYNHGYRSIAINLPKTLAMKKRAAFLAEILNAVALDQSAIVVVSASFSGTFATPYIIGQGTHFDHRIAGYISVAAQSGPIQDETNVMSDVPLLMIYGENDPLLLSDPPEFRRMFRDTKLRVVENEGHVCYMNPESSKIFTSYVLNFLSKRARWNEAITTSNFKSQKHHVSETFVKTEERSTSLQILFFASCVTIVLLIWWHFNVSKSKFNRHH